MYGIGFIYALTIAVMAVMDSIVVMPPCLCILESAEDASIECGINGPDYHQLRRSNGHKSLLFIRL